MYRDFTQATLDARHLSTDAEAAPKEVARQILDRLAAGSLRWRAPGSSHIRQGSGIAAERVFALAGKGGMRAGMLERDPGIRSGLPGAQHHRQMVPRQSLRRMWAGNRRNRLDREPSRGAGRRS